MPSQRRLQSLGPNVVGDVGKPGAQGWRAPLELGKLPRQGPCRGCGGRPGKGLAGGAHLALCSLCFCLGVALVVLWFCFLCPAKGGQGRGAATARAQVKGCKKGPLLLYTDRIPRAWATYERRALLGQAQNGARARVRWSFYRSNSLARLRFPTTRVECMTWGSCVGRLPPSCITSQ